MVKAIEVPPNLDPLWWADAILRSGADVGCWSEYARGYRLAADALSLNAVKDLDQLSCLIYPIMFLYRHYLELRLKETIVLGRPGQSGIPGHHDLLRLWEDARPVLGGLENRGFLTLDEADALVREFIEVDRQSQVFRYPMTRSGDKVLPRDFIVSTLGLRDGMICLADRLDAATAALAERSDESLP